MTSNIYPKAEIMDTRGNQAARQGQKVSQTTRIGVQKHPKTCFWQQPVIFGKVRFWERTDSASKQVALFANARFGEKEPDGVLISAFWRKWGIQTGPKRFIDQSHLVSGAV